MFSYLNCSLDVIHEALVNKIITPLDLVKEAIEGLKKDPHNALEATNYDEALKMAAELKIPEVDNIFWGIPYVAKDNYSTNNLETTASSNILKGYVPLFSATVIEKLSKAHAILLAKTTMDELAMGGTGTSGHKGATTNPYDPSLKTAVGGSSAGSASLVASGLVPFSLGSDTGDSVRKPAHFSGLVGFKPTWGLISRYGLFPFAPSLDTVAYFTRNVSDAIPLLNLLRGYDKLDPTSAKGELKNKTKGQRLGYIKEVIDDIKDEAVLASFYENIEKLREAGFEVKEVHLSKSLLLAIYPAYMIISSSEATSNNANLDGIKFGPRPNATSYQELIIKARTEGFGDAIKRRFVIGSYALKRDNQNVLFKRAQKVRRLISEAVTELLNNECDYLIMPAGGTIAPKLSELTYGWAKTPSIIENHLAIANFGGFPSLTFPSGIIKGFPIGINITSNLFTDSELLNLGVRCQEIIGYKNLSARRER